MHRSKPNDLDYRRSRRPEGIPKPDGEVKGMKIIQDL
jgi:hypothetical protein